MPSGEYTQPHSPGWGTETYVSMRPYASITVATRLPQQRFRVAAAAKARRVCDIDIQRRIDKPMVCDSHVSCIRQKLQTRCSHITCIHSVSANLPGDSSYTSADEAAAAFYVRGKRSH